MTEVYLTRMVLNPRSRAVWNDLGNLQQLHRTVCSAFPPIENDPGLKEHEKRKPRGEYNLLHRIDIEPKGGLAVLFVQSSTKPDWSSLRDGYAEEIKCKTVHEQYAKIENGMKLLFRLHANPTKRIGKNFQLDDKYQRLDEKKREEFTLKFRDERTRRRVSLNGDEERIDWLKRKGAGAGFRLATIKVKDSVPNVRYAGEPKIKARKKRDEDPMTFGSVVFEGVLEVTDAKIFREALVKGIGTGKAYGFGLLSIAPVREASRVCA